MADIEPLIKSNVVNGVEQNIARNAPNNLIFSDEKNILEIR